MPTLEPAVPTSSLSDAKRKLLAQRLAGSSTSSLAIEETVSPLPVREPGAITLIGPEQYSVWLDATLQPDLPTYNEAVTVYFHGALRAEILEAAFNTFVARHAAWRTAFLVRNGEVHQETADETVVKFASVDLKHLGTVEAEIESVRVAHMQAMVPLDMEVAPLLRASLVQISEEDYRLHLVLHHLIFDGFSLRRTFLPELIALYEAYSVGSPSPLRALSHEYGDFTAWRRHQTELPAMEGALNYWRKQLAGELPVLRLPTDRPRPAAISHRGDVVSFSLSQEVTAALRRVAQLQGATLYLALLATFKVLLFRYSGQQDLIVGSVSDGRRRSELFEMMGYILDVFAVRTAPEPATPFAEYLGHVKRTVLAALDASEVPFERVVAALSEQDSQQRRDLSHQPIFQTVFVFSPTVPSPSPAWEIRNSGISTGAAKFDLYVEADERPLETEIRISFSTDLFDTATISRMVGHWVTLIEGAVAEPTCSIGKLPMLTAQERQRTLVDWNETVVELPGEPSLRTMHGLVAAQAARTPHAPAIRFESSELTYAEVERHSDRIATALEAAGSARGRLAAIFLDRSEHLVTGLLGILKTGAAYLPLDPGTPSARIKLCLEDAAPAVILTQRSRIKDLPPTAAKLVVIEDLLEVDFPNSYRPSPYDPESLAYIIHTSGSTGRPKGVELRHAGVANLLFSMQRAPGLTAKDTLVAVTTISFDIAVLEIFLPLISGGKVVLASRADVLDPEVLSELVEKSHCTVLQATPATWSALLASGWKGQAGLKILCGGEALNRSLADRLLALPVTPAHELWNMYGPTETTIWSTAFQVHEGKGPIAVGRPIANTTAYILDAQQEPVPVGVAGELFLGGIGLANGYWNRPELTAERFVSPAIAHGERLYRTGDYAIYRADGIIEVQGRSDNQVKIRGYRIELEDIEVNLTAHPGVAFAAAKAWPDEAGGYSLAAYLVGVGGPPPGAAELRQFLRGRVADYMIPSDIIALDAMPLTSNGKIDRKQLVEPVRFVALESPIPIALYGEELRIARIWTELLRVNRVGAKDNFFDLGGHSLLLLKLVRMINTEFAIELPITRLFAAPTVEKLAVVVREIASNRGNNAWTSLVPLNPTGTKTPLFLIHSLMLYGRLPAALGEDQPFYALQPLPFDQDESGEWVERMLEDHIAQIKGVQPGGPYQIAGWCFAGWMAYEIARRLEARGDKVSTLALLDSWCPYKVKSHAVAGTAAASYAGEHSIADRLRSLRFKLEFNIKRSRQQSASNQKNWLTGLVGQLMAAYSIPVERQFKSALYRTCRQLRLPLPGFLRDPNVVTYDWLRHYTLRSYAGNITLIRPDSTPLGPGSDPNCGWRALTSGTISAVSVPGDRSSMFLMPNLTRTAEVLRQTMAFGPPFMDRRRATRSSAEPLRIGRGSVEMRRGLEELEFSVTRRDLRAP